MSKCLALSLKALVSGTLLYLVFRGVDTAKLQIILAQARASLIVLAVVLYSLGQMVCAYRWKMLMSPVGLDLPYGRALSFYFLGMFFNLFFPTLIGGDAVKVYYLTREGGDVVRSSTTVLMDRNTGLGALLLLAGAVAGVTRVHLTRMPLFPLLSAIIVGFVLANFILFYDLSYQVLARSWERLRLTKLVAGTQQLHAALAAYRRSVPQVAGAVGLSLIFDLGLIGSAYVASTAIGWPVSFTYFCVFIPLISLISMAPITLYGLGLREYSFVLFFSQVGMSREASLLLAFLMFFIVLVASLPGAIIYIVYRREAGALSPGQGGLL